MPPEVLVGGAVCVAVTLLVLVIRLYVMLHHLDTSIAKLGYVIREDAKKYFDDAAAKIVDTDVQFQTMYTKIVHEGTAQALTDVSDSVEKAITSANTEANNIIMQAHKEAQNIMTSAQGEVAAQSDRALGESAATIAYVMEQYSGQTMNLDEHQALIKRLLDEYVSENKR